MRRRYDILVMLVFCPLWTETVAVAAAECAVKYDDGLGSVASTRGCGRGRFCKANDCLHDRSSIRFEQKIIMGEFLDELGGISLFAGETESDITFNKSNDGHPRNSLFMRRRVAAGTNEWLLVMTAEGDWKLADGMCKWCEGCASDARRDFQVLKAKLSKDRQFIWMVCNPHTSTYHLVCSLELATKKYRVLIDGDSVTEQTDGTLFVEGKKTYLSDENGEPLGAAWYDLWITTDGKVVRKTRPISKAEMEKECDRQNVSK